MRLAASLMPTASSISRPRFRASALEIFSWIRRGFDELLADPQVGIERGHGVLENHAHAFAADGAGLGGGAAQEVNAVEHRGTALDAAGRGGDEPHDGVAGDGFAGAGLAHDPEGFPALDAEAHAIDRPVNATARMKVGAKVGNGEQGHDWIGWVKRERDPGCSNVKTERRRAQGGARWKIKKVDGRVGVELDIAGSGTGPTTCYHNEKCAGVARRGT